MKYRLWKWGWITVSEETEAAFKAREFAEHKHSPVGGWPWAFIGGETDLVLRCEYVKQGCYYGYRPFTRKSWKLERSIEYQETVKPEELHDWHEAIRRAYEKSHKERND